MTDNEIIERLKENAEYDCNKCCYYDEWCNGTTSRCNVVIARNALELIRKQQAEIDRLKAEQPTGINELLVIVEDDIRAEAIKEFAGKLKQNLSFGKYITAEQIDNLAKEMVGDDNG